MRAIHADLPAVAYPWRAQPDGISCGPTCISMLRDGLGRRAGIPDGPDPRGVAAMCGTNTRTGTTHEGVAVALPGLGLHGDRVTGRAAFREAFAAAMAAGDPVLLRTLTYGCKHWVLAARRRGDGRYDLLDPGSGPIVRTAAEVERLVAPRDHEIWPVDARRVPYRIDLGSLVPAGAGASERAERIGEAVALARGPFERFVDGIDFREYLDANVDWDLTRALRVEGRLAGVYMLRERPVREEAPDAAGGPLDRLRAVEGVGLAVAEDARGLGYGRLLRDQPRAMGYGLVWGLQDKRLGNLDRWLARRTLVGDTGDSWVTAEVLPEPGHRARPDPGAAYGP